MRSGTAGATWFLLLVVTATATAGSAMDEARFPAELQGVWDAYPTPCVAADMSDSDMRISIEPNALRGYENNDALKSIEKIADAPATWQVVTISDIAPAGIQGEADIYVLHKDALTITNGERAYTHIRCN